MLRPRLGGRCLAPPTPSVCVRVCTGTCACVSNPGVLLAPAMSLLVDITQMAFQRTFAPQPYQICQVTMQQLATKLFQPECRVADMKDAWLAEAGASARWPAAGPRL
jgi:hypothetical protein